MFVSILHSRFYGVSSLTPLGAILLHKRVIVICPSRVSDDSLLAVLNDTRYIVPSNHLDRYAVFRRGGACADTAYLSFNES